MAELEYVCEKTNSVITVRVDSGKVLLCGCGQCKKHPGYYDPAVGTGTEKEVIDNYGQPVKRITVNCSNLG